MLYLQPYDQRESIQGPIRAIPAPDARDRRFEISTLRQVSRQNKRAEQGRYIEIRFGCDLVATA